MATDAPAHMRATALADCQRRVDRAAEPPRETVACEGPRLAGHLPGQHIDLRLTAPDGYQAQRSFSIASAPHEPGLSLAVEHVAEGEVSLHHDRGSGRRYFRAARADRRLLRVGGAVGGPLFLCAGGSGIAPFSTCSSIARVAGGLPTALSLCATPEDAMFATRIDALARADPALQIVWTYTRAAPQAWTGYTRRIDAAMLRATAPRPDAQPLIYVCGPTPHVELVATTWSSSATDRAAYAQSVLDPRE